jgi:hypothetical protein
MVFFKSILFALDQSIKANSFSFVTQLTIDNGWRLLKRKRKCCSEDGNVSSHAKEIMKNN